MDIYADVYVKEIRVYTRVSTPTHEMEKCVADMRVLNACVYVYLICNFMYDRHEFFFYIKYRHTSKSSLRRRNIYVLKRIKSNKIISF